MPQEINQEKLNIRPKPVVLIILDGWGVAKDSVGNAITKAKLPNFERYCREYFCSILQASGEAVGLPWDEMGNSEVGHINIGAGKIMYQNLPRINKAISGGDFFVNPALLKAIKHVDKNKSGLHLIGLLSDGGVHSSEDHLYNLLELAKQQKVNQVYVHVILDGRDTPYNTGIGYIEKLQRQIDKIGIGQIVSVAGRYWSMDRDNHWERTKQSYDTMTGQRSLPKFDDPIKGVQASYDKKVFDEELEPLIVDSEVNKFRPISKNDAVIFFNFRADRARQLTKAFVLPTFDKFRPRPYIDNLFFVSMTQYEQYLPVEVAFPPETIEWPLARVISESGLSQLHIAETEKYAHVTYFVNGGREKTFKGEDQVLIPSPRVSSYDQKPEMSALDIKNRIVKEVGKGDYDFILINFANPDMVAHTGNLKATIKALKVVDTCLGEIVDVTLSKGGVLVVTADHGNAEGLIKLQTGEIDKEHSTSPVPFLVIGQSYKKGEPVGDGKGKPDLSLLTPSGILADVAPTVLSILNLNKPVAMIGRGLV